ncbi:DUF1775 domain-containing protein, partial [Micromonospora sp. ATA32]|nr:DUF1775 domain-containing protein [Micromonospora sp. ATA32]
MTRDDSPRGRARAVAAVAAVLAGALGLPGTALAGVDVDEHPRRGPPGRRGAAGVRGARGAGGRAYGQRRDPAATRTPIAEVYPMSVPGWAPRITSQKLDQPVAGIHAAGVDTITASVVWTRASGSPAGPARLALSMGPLPQAERLPFEVIQTYSDGTVVRWSDQAG